jgi:tetratricopeptide (TPR) repeat protein/transcriptional regulator with XRE-family HTH domain
VSTDQHGEAGEQGDFGGLLRRRRTAAGLTQEELAGRAGLSVRAVRDLERGASRPHRRTCGRLADALELTAADRDEFGRAARGPAAGNAVPNHGEAAAAQPVPRQLPAAAAGFTGRAAELKTLTGLLEHGQQPPGTVLITAIGGTAGVGKTALAVHWAHQVAGRFPDGQLYVNLRGYDPDQPMAAADALAAFLRALGLPGRDIPAGLDERAASYRSLLAGRRMLVLLDNAGSAEQVRPLLPASPACLAVVTSRDTLAGLVARDGARRLDLDLMSPADADILLTTLIGDRAAADPAATAALATACARLPLALRVAAELATARPGTALATLVTELAGEQRRLDLLDADGDPRTAVRAVFSWSYRQLDPATARAFRLLSLYPGADVEAHAAAALTGLPLGRTQQLLDTLARANLIHATAAGHYGQHDLLRGYARELAAEAEGTGQTRAALTRLFDHYLHTAAVAMDTLFPAQRHTRPRVPAPATPIPPVTEPAAARAWLEDRRDALIAAAVHTAEHGWPRHATRLAVTLFRQLNSGGHHAEAVTVLSCARRAAQRAGDRASEAEVLLSLGNIGWTKGRYRQATRYLRRAGVMFREIGDRNAQARTLHELGTIGMLEGRYPDSVRDHEQAIALFRETGDKAGEARALCNLAAIDLNQGHYQQATGHIQQGLVLCQQTGDVVCEAHLRDNFGVIEQRQGRYTEAIGQHRQAMALHRQTGHVAGEAHALASIGNASQRLGRLAEAVRCYRQALAMFRRTGARYGEVSVRNGLGVAHLAAGRPDRAHAHHAAALALARELGEKSEWAQAHDGLGHACQMLGDAEQARQHWDEALTLYTSLGAPQADEVRASLAALGPGPSQQAE